MPLVVDKNIWVAAGDGDLSRVRVSSLSASHFIPISPNVPDSFTYTPMHAAASYGHLDVLTYLVSMGGNVNVTDEDGDTPLYSVENVETARFLVDNGADLAWRNHEGFTPAASLANDFPQVSAYLNSITATPPGPPETFCPPSQYSQEMASERLTCSLMNQLRDIAQDETGGGEGLRDEELRQAVTATVLEGMVTGYSLAHGDNTETLDHVSGKRGRMEGPDGEGHL
ncbi:ankyrin [Russula earlei]|uniref:Ankyrin n=1 Tax=Russula earlei TaxID=71964 RepID=A0ACC0ULU7_9AGAM|nr:ankyrin [Russula earlei]